MLRQKHDPEFLGHQLASETAGILDNYHSDAISLDPVEQRFETWPSFNRVRAAHGGVVMLADELEAVPLSKSAIAWRRRFSLPLSAPPLLAELVRRYAIAGVCVLAGLAKAPRLTPELTPTPNSATVSPVQKPLNPELADFAKARLTGLRTGTVHKLKREMAAT